MALDPFEQQQFGTAGVEWVKFLWLTYLRLCCWSQIVADRVSLRTEYSGEWVVTTRRRVIDARRLEVYRSPGDRSRGDRDAVRLAVNGGTRHGRPADRVEAGVIKTERVSLAKVDVLLAVKRDIDVTQLSGLHERLCN